MNAFRAAVENRDLDAMRAALHPEVVFRSPAMFTPYEGIDTVMGLLGHVIEVFEDFEYTDELSGENWATISWLMHFRHPSLGGGKLISVRGITQIRFTDRVYYHEDFYDHGAMIYQHVPMLGGIIRFINQRIGR